MLFKNVVIHSLEYVLPEEIWTSADIEYKLKGLYDRLNLPLGRLELMTGIQERRFFPVGMKPSQAAALAGKKALEKAQILPQSIGVVMHTGVCRDALEPATAAYVHNALNLGDSVQIMDVSNACLGFLNGMVLLGGLIEGGVVQAGLIVSGENARPLLENTIEILLNRNLDRKSIKPYFANLTIGSGAVAAVMCHSSLGNGFRLLGGAGLTDSTVCHFCEGQAGNNGSLDMQTDAENLLHAGLDLAYKNWKNFKKQMDWSEEIVDNIICHQVGKQHKIKLYERLGLSLKKDFSTYEFLGNMGSVSLPLTLCMALERGYIQPNAKIGLLGIGSGLSSLMLGLSL